MDNFGQVLEGLRAQQFGLGQLRILAGFKGFGADMFHFRRAIGPFFTNQGGR